MFQPDLNSLLYSLHAHPHRVYPLYHTTLSTNKKFSVTIVQRHTVSICDSRKTRRTRVNYSLPFVAPKIKGINITIRTNTCNCNSNLFQIESLLSRCSIIKGDTHPRSDPRQWDQSLSSSTAVNISTIQWQQSPQICTCYIIIYKLTEI